MVLMHTAHRNQFLSFCGNAVSVVHYNVDILSRFLLMAFQPPAQPPLFLIQATKIIQPCYDSIEFRSIVPSLFSLSAFLTFLNLRKLLLTQELHSNMCTRYATMLAGKITTSVFASSNGNGFSLVE